MHENPYCCITVCILALFFFFVTASVAWHTNYKRYKHIKRHASIPRAYSYILVLYSFVFTMHLYYNIIFWPLKSYAPYTPLYAVYIPCTVHPHIHYIPNLDQRTRTSDLVLQKRKHMYPVSGIRSRPASRVAKSLGALGVNCLNKWSANRH